MRSHLKVKVVSLSAEMTYIRRQEEKWKSRARYAREKQKQESLQYAEKNFWSHRWHREQLKCDARIAHLAYGCMRNMPYSRMEHICYGRGMGGYEPDWKGIEATVERFSKDEDKPQDLMQRFAEWLADAKKWHEGNPERIEAFAAERPARVAAMKALKKPFKAA